MKQKNIIFLMIAMSLPAVYELATRAFVGDMGGSSVAIYQSYESLEVLFEIILEFLPLSALILIGLNYRDEIKTNTIINTVLISQIVLSLIFVVLSILFMDYFLDLTNVSEALIVETKLFFILNTLTFPLYAAYTFLIKVLFVKRDNDRLSMIVAGVYVLITFILDVLLISGQTFSLDLGLPGIAISKFIALLSINLLIIYICRNDGWLNCKKYFSLKTMKSVLREGRYSGLESLIRNMGYILGTVAIVNMLAVSSPEEMLIYNTTMSILWSLVLIPILIGTELLRINNSNKIADNEDIIAINDKAFIYFMIYTCITFLLTFVFFEQINTFLNGSIELDSSAYNDIIVSTLLGYVCFSVTSIVRALTLSTNNIHSTFISSLASNLLIFLPMYYVFNIQSVQEFLVFTFIGMFIGAVIDVIFYVKTRKKLQYENHNQYIVECAKI